MCTVVFIPNNKDLYFASLRDESAERPAATAPEYYSLNGSGFLAPIDTLAGGTWLGISESGNVIILLNGGFEKHIVKKIYRKSRGLIVKDLLVSHSPVSMWMQMDVTEIEPFTLIIWSNAKLFQLVWDGFKKQKIELDPHLPYIWSSSTLYNITAKTRREKLFKQWISEKPVINQKSLLSFFLTETDVENGFIINRNEQIKTQSYTFINIHEKLSGKMQYHDFITNRETTKEMVFENATARISLTNIFQN